MQKYLRARRNDLFGAVDPTDTIPGCGRAAAQAAIHHASARLREKVFAIAANLRLENPRPQGVEAGIEETYYGQRTRWQLHRALVAAARKQPKASGGFGKVVNALVMAASYDPDPRQFLGIRLPSDSTPARSSRNAGRIGLRKIL